MNTQNNNTTNYFLSEKHAVFHCFFSHSVTCVDHIWRGPSWVCGDMWHRLKQFPAKSIPIMCTTHLRHSGNRVKCLLTTGFFALGCHRIFEFQPDCILKTYDQPHPRFDPGPTWRMIWSQPRPTRRGVNIPRSNDSHMLLFVEEAMELTEEGAAHLETISGR